MEEVSQPETSLTGSVEEEKSSLDTPGKEAEDASVKIPIGDENQPDAEENHSESKQLTSVDSQVEDETPEEKEQEKEKEDNVIQEELQADSTSQDSVQELNTAKDGEIDNDSEEAKADTSGIDANETVFEEVDANVSAEKPAATEESDMLGESDMTVPEKEIPTEAADDTADKPSPMEVDISSNEDVEMTSMEDEENKVSNEKEAEAEQESREVEEKKSQTEGENVVDTMEEDPKSVEAVPEGQDIVDDAAMEEPTEKPDKPTNENPVAEKEHGEDVEQPPDKETNEPDTVANDADEEEAEQEVTEAVEEEGLPAEDEDETSHNNVPEEAETSATREEDADPDVENVQEPEESDVCLIPDTETEMTDAEKERAIQARENAEKEGELAEDIAEEKEACDPSLEETAQEPLLEELLPSEPVLEGGAPHKTIIFLAVSARHKCTQCDKQKICGFRYKDAEKTTTDYICEMACVDNLLAANPGKFFLRRKKFLVDEVPDDDTDDHKCLQCKKNKSNSKYFFKQDEEIFYICSEDCYKALSTDEPEKFNLKRDSIRVRNIGHTTISSKGSNNTDSRIVSRSATEAEAARVERAASFLRRCSECMSEIQLRLNSKNLVWQTMDFCDELCLGKYQRHIGSQCQTCHGEVPHQSLGKYCVRFGFEIRQFCCATCLNNYKKGLKTCSCCQKDISGSGEGFLAPVGDKEQFKDFCSQSCMRRYDSMCNAKKKLRTDRCAVCNFEKPMRVEMTIDGKEQNFCSNPCFSAFKFVSNIVPDQCGMCSKYFERKSSESFTIYGEKQRPKVFCSRICFNVFIIVNRQITSCQWCKVKKYDFDMIMKVVDQRQVMMCSLNCLTLYGVSINAFSRAAIKCDNCNACTTPQYHLTMSDASMRNFCTYQCVMQFQSQFARVPLTLDSEAVATATHHVSPKQQSSKNSNIATPFPTGLPKRVKLNANQMKTVGSTPPPITKNQQNQNNQAQMPVMPVISNVASLATGENETLIGNTTVRRGPTRGRGRGKKFVNESRPPRIPTPPAPPTTRTRSSTSSPILPAAPPTTVSNKPQLRGGRTSTRSSAVTTPEVARSVSPIIEKHVETKIVTVPPYPPMVRNVQTTCHPKTEDASIDCRPQTSEIGIQTDEDFSSKILIPVPVPIFIPQPMYMYSAPFPVPVPIPLPIPVPIFIPTTRNSSNGILKEIKKIQDKMPADPFEAELLMMAEMVADEKNESDSDSEEDTKPEPRMIQVQYPTPTPQTNNVEVSMEPQNNTSFGEDVLQMALKMASGEYEEPSVDLESAMTANTITHPPPGMVQSSPVGEDSGMQMGHHMMMDSQRGGRARKRGAIASPITPRNNRSPIKRQRLSVDTNTPTQQSVMPVEKPDANMCLKFTFGVNAWKQWVMTKNADIEKSSIRRRLFKTELLQMTADELNYSLCLFVKEVRKPNGTEYAPDTIYYLVLGIQQYLYENLRIDNIFTDPYYERFTDCLDEVARKFSVLYNDSQYIVTRVEEEHLWECKQLGAHSPHVLLSTLMFFNTKHFNLTTVEEHMQLSFSHIMKHWKRSAQNAKTPGTRNVLLRFYPPQAGLDANPRKKKVYEQQENEENPLRCPVRLYEFYLSKCPESVKTRNDVFYLQPERSCVPDSPVWYSTQALSQEALQKMLHRVKMVKEINIALLTS